MLNAGFYPAAAAALYHYSAAAASGGDGAAASLSPSLSTLISSSVWCGQISDRAQLTANTHTQSWLARLSAHVLQHHQQQQQSRSRRCLISSSAVSLCSVPKTAQPPTLLMLVAQVFSCTTNDCHPVRRYVNQFLPPSLGSPQIAVGPNLCRSRSSSSSRKSTNTTTFGTERQTEQQYNH